MDSVLHCKQKTLKDMKQCLRLTLCALSLLALTPATVIAQASASATSTYTQQLGQLYGVYSALAALPDGTNLTGAQIASLPQDWICPFLHQANDAVPILDSITASDKDVTVAYHYSGWAGGWAGGWPCSYQVTAIKHANTIEVVVQDAYSYTYAYMNHQVNTTKTDVGGGSDESYQIASPTDALLSSLGSAAYGTLTASQVALLPNDMQSAINAIAGQYSAVPGFSDTITFTRNSNDANIGALYTFSMNYATATPTTVSASSAYYDSSGFYVAGGPPPEVLFGSNFDVNVTLQAWSCDNAEIGIESSTTANGQTVNKNYFAQGQHADGGEGLYFTDASDYYLGTFTAPNKTDTDLSTGKIFGNEQDPALPVSTGIQTYVWGGSGDYEHLYAGWSVNLIQPPAVATKRVQLSVIAKPSTSYQSWFANSAPQIISVTVPGR
jgi:hypothetical protein